MLQNIFKCEICNTFKTLTNLNKHKRNTKYCKLLLNNKKYFKNITNKLNYLHLIYLKNIF